MNWEMLLELWKDERVRRAVWTGVAVVVLLVGYAVYRESQKPRRAPEAELTLLQAMTMLSNPQGMNTADSLLQDVIARHPGTVEAHRARYYLGYLRLQQGNLDEAEQAFRAVLQSNLQDPVLRAEAEGHLGTILAARGDWDGALEAFARARDLAPLEALKALYLFRQAEVSFAAGRYQRAVELLDQMEKEHGRTILFTQEGRTLRSMARGLGKASGG